MKKCHFCDSTEITKVRMKNEALTSYMCPICKWVILQQESAEDFKRHGYTGKDKKVISICIRNKYELLGEKAFPQPLTLEDLDQMKKQYRLLDPLEKMDNALLNLERKTNYVGDSFRVNYEHEYPFFHCLEPGELVRIIEFLEEGEAITGEGVSFNSQGNMYITAKGYEKLREIKRRREDSRQCFVAMWLAPELNNVYNSAIEPAIEYIEDGETEPRFKALRIDNKEHTNDINDEIISEIRRSRFMVCDLTGYRGGVYWEAGFAYGLGLKVIYTCRKDWVKKQTLNDEKGEKVKELFDKKNNPIEVNKEGIHFDLEHRNRISWEEKDLDGFKGKLTNCIKAVII